MSEASIDEIKIFYVEVGRRIRDARVKAGQTQSDLASAVGLTRTSVTNLEAGRQRIPLHLLALIEATLDVPPGGLLPSELLRPKERLTNTIDRHLAEAPETTRTFVKKAIANLREAAREEE